MRLSEEGDYVIISDQRTKKNMARHRGNHRENTKKRDKATKKNDGKGQHHVTDPRTSPLLK